MTETYRIDEANKRVYVTWHGAFMEGVWIPFDWLASQPGIWPSNDPERAMCYLIARDELIERGLIADPAEVTG